MRRRIAVLALLVACGGDDGTKTNTNTSGIPDACNPLGGQGCLLPWPSSTYLAADTTSATGLRVALPIEAMPVNDDALPVDPKMLNRWDGFSPSGFMLASFPTGVSTDGLPPFSDPDKSLAADCPIVLLDLDTGERAPFFAETDKNNPEGATRYLIIRPLKRLHEKAHYAVAITNRAKAADGSGALVPSPGFQAILDGTSFGHPKFADVAAKYDDIFAKLATAGVDKASIVLAWDFTTASDDFLRSDLTKMRTDALPAMGTNGSSLSFTSSVVEPNALSHARYTGTYKSPDFLTNKEADDSIIRRDANGAPMMQGLRDAKFAAIVPKCAETHSLPLPTLVFGHGLFGSAASYLDDNFTQTLANEYCFVIVAGDFIGLTERQIALAPLAVNDMNNAPRISEKLGQSIIDFMSLETLTRNQMATAPEFKVNGVNAIDPTKVFYVGGSLGGIMGNVFMAYDPNITRGVLAVPGGVWSMLFERSNAWFALINTAQASYHPDVYELVVAVLGMAMEPYDAITTAAHVISDPLFGNPVKNILMWYSEGDCLVSNITTEMVARTMGIDVLAPSVKTAWGLTAKPAAGLVNAINLFNDHPTPLPPDTNNPPSEDNGTHSGINKKQAALRMVSSFLIDTKVANGCVDSGGQAVACDCATGACD